MNPVDVTREKRPIVEISDTRWPPSAPALTWWATAATPLSFRRKLDPPADSLLASLGNFAVNRLG